MTKNSQKLTLIAVITWLSFITPSCREVDKLTQFNIEYDETVVIPSNTGINLPIDIVTPPIETNAESKFAVNDTRKDMIEEIILTQADVEVASPTDGDFSFLESISIYIRAEGLEEQRMAYRENIPDDIGSTMSLQTTGADLKEYIKKEEFSLRVHAVKDKLITEDYHVNIHSVFFVDARILGQ